MDAAMVNPAHEFTYFFFTLVTGPRSSLSLKRSDSRVYEPQIRARLGTTAHQPNVDGPVSSRRDGQPRTGVHIRVLSVIYMLLHRFYIVYRQVFYVPWFLHFEPSLDGRLKFTVRRHKFNKV